MSAEPELPPGDPRRPAEELLRWWNVERAGCRICPPGRCACGPVCANCGDLLGKYPDRPWPERCPICLFEHPGRFGHVLHTRDSELDERRRANLDAAVAWWNARPDRTPPVLYWLIPQIAQLVDRGTFAGRPFELFAVAAAKLTSEHALDARLVCSAFCDDCGPDLDLLIFSWCRSQWFEPHPAPRRW